MENRALARHVMQVQEDERRYIAREMHDDMGQYLTAIRLDAAALSANADMATTIHAQRIISYADHIHDAMKELLHQLRHAALDAQGLIAALKTLVEEWESQHANIRCNLALNENCLNLPQLFNIVIYRVVQEALTNVARHAQARHVDIALTVSNVTSPAFIKLDISDDGIGLNAATCCYGFGLTGMRERVEGAGGTLGLICESGQGLRVSVNIPLSLDI
jgi:glucose-6-phosphate-specific signal transduction histidine kinase